VLDSLVDAGVEELVLNVQPNRVDGFQYQALNQDSLARADVTVQAASIVEDESRYIHAKLMHLTTPEESHILYGSSNATTSALLKTSEKRNIELSVLRTESDPTYFDEVIGSNFVETREIEPSTVEHRRHSISTTPPSADFQLLEARLSENEGLFIGFEGIEASKGTLHLRRGKSNEELDIEVSGLENGEFRTSKGKIVNFCGEATRVFLSATSSGDMLESSKRWIAFSSLNNAPRRSERKAIELSNGRYNLIKILNRADESAKIDFLESIKFDTNGPKRITVLNRLEHNPPEPGGSGIEPRDLDLIEIAENKIELFHEDIDREPFSLSGYTSWEDKLDSFVDLYISGSKLTLWYVLDEDGDINNLRFIMQSTKKLLSLIRRVRSAVEERDAHRLEKDSQLLGHVSIIAYLVDQGQVRAGAHRGASETVYQIFRDTWKEAIETLGETRRSPVPPDEALNNSPIEYNELNYSLPDPDQISRFVGELADKSE